MTPDFDANGARTPSEIPPARIEGEAAQAHGVDAGIDTQVTYLQCNRIAKATGQRCRKVAIEGETYCLAHAPRSHQATVGFGGSENGRKGGEARRVRKPLELLREAIADHMLLLLKPYMDTLGLDATYNEALDKIELREAAPYEVPYTDRFGETEIVMVQPGAKLSSTANGYVNMSHFDDLMARVKVAGELFDRAFGKAGSTLAITGADGGALEVRVGQALTDRGVQLAAELADEIAESEGDDG